MAEFHAYFGGAPTPVFTLVEPAEGEMPSLVCGTKKVVVKQSGVPFTLYYQMLMFFGNGGGPCYIVSVGDYTADSLDADALKAGIDMLSLAGDAAVVHSGADHAKGGQAAHPVAQGGANLGGRAVGVAGHVHDAGDGLGDDVS